MDNNDQKSNNFAAGAIFGMLVGAAIALLVTPKTGKEMRDDLKEKWQKGKEKLKNTDANAELEKLFEEFRSKASRLARESQKGIEE